MTPPSFATLKTWKLKELLAALPEGSWAVVTSATERLARSRMAHAGIKIPKHFVTAETVKQGKPHPEPYRFGAALLGAPPADCLVVEDAPAGVGSGKAAGCPVLAVLTTYPPETLMDANWRIPTLAGIRADPDLSDRIHLQFDSED